MNCQLINEVVPVTSLPVESYAGNGSLPVASWWINIACFLNPSLATLSYYSRTLLPPLTLLVVMYHSLLSVVVCDHVTTVTRSSQRASHIPSHFTLLNSHLHLRLIHPLPFIYSSTPLYLQLPLSPDTLNCCPLRCTTLLASRSRVGKSVADQVAPHEVKNLVWRKPSYNTVNTEDIQSET